MLRQLLMLWAFTLMLALPCRAAGEDEGTAARAKHGSPFGIHGPTYSHWLSANHPNLWLEGEARFRVLMDSGAGWARQDFWWGLVEPKQGTFVWEDFDRAIEAYEQHGINLMVILCYASPWSGGASPDNDAERAFFANYVYQMVNRYKGRVAAWEIWNEPNIQPYWSPRPDPVLYAKLLQAAYAAAKKADPDCVVVGGVMAGPDHAFLAGMYEAGAKGHFDILSYHNYGQQNEIETEWPAIEKLRVVMAQYGDTETPIWHTETGFHTGPVGLTEPQQAAKIVRYSVGLLALGVERMFQLTLMDWTDDPKHHDLSVYRGLTHADYRTKRSYAAYRTMCQRLGDKRFAGAIRPAPGVSGYMFRGADETVLVLWRADSKEASPVPLDLGSPVVLVQQMEGDWRVHRNEKGLYALTVGPEPVYVMDPGPPITNQCRVQWPNPVVTQVPHSAGAVVEATVTNPTSDPMMFRLYPQGPAGEGFAEGEVAAGSTTSVSVKVDASELEVGAHELFWRLAPVGTSTPFAQGFRLAKVESPLSLSFEPLKRLRADEPRLPLCITYTGSQPSDGIVTLQLDGRPSGEPLKVELMPGQPQRFELPINLEAFGRGKAIPVGVELEAEGLKLTTGCSRPLLPCERAPEQASIDGDLNEWQGRKADIRPSMLCWEYVNAQETPPAEDLSVTGWVGYNARGLWIAIRVEDDDFAFPQSRAVWNWDSIQIGLDLGSDARPNEPYDANDLEIEVGHKADGPAWCYLGACPEGWPQAELSSRLKGVVRPNREDGFVTYEVLVPADLLVSVMSLTPDSVIGFSILVNDNDGDGRSGWQELTPGIGLGKRPSEFAWLWLR